MHTKQRQYKANKDNKDNIDYIKVQWSVNLWLCVHQVYSVIQLDLGKLVEFSKYHLPSCHMPVVRLRAGHIPLKKKALEESKLAA